MDNTALLILEQLKHMLKETRYFIETRTFLITQISFKNSDLVIIKTLMLKEFTTVERFLKGIGANNLPLFYDGKSVFKKKFLLDY